MMDRRSILARLIGAGIAVALSSGPALAADAVAFTPDAFIAAQKAGVPILIDVRAPWCPICKRQAPILEKLLAEPRFKAVQRFDIDFDTQKSALRAVGALMQSTLIAFKGEKETGRSIGQTQPEWLEDLLEKLL